MSTEEATAPATGGRRIRWLVGAVALLALAVAVVLLARWLRELEPVRGFLAEFPGPAPIPHETPVGLPAWLGWQHFFNLFLLALVVRTGLQARAEKRPAALWTSRRNRRRRMSLTVWSHLVLDALWIVNGVVYVVLLFATGQWMRIVPTSPDVVPNALSAALQYASLDWPLGDGWVNYNALQQLAYFATVFVAAPLAIATGLRMSALWPRDAARLNRLYPFGLAKAVHLPVMLYFVAFTVVHVVLVLATGALRNLDHMFAARDASDGWGAAIAAVAVLATAGCWALVRGTVAAPLARRVGEVSER